MNAEIVAVGSELLTPQRVDTNSLYLTDQLNALGVEVVMKHVVGDDRQRLTDLMRAVMRRSELVVITGGLGPTEDDVTRDAAADALGRPLLFRQNLCDDIAARFRRIGRPMADINRRQAYLIKGAEALPNQNGTAPGQWFQQNHQAVMLLPGPPRELKPMFEQECLPRLHTLVPAQVIRTLFWRVTGMGESDLDQLIAPVYTKYQNPATTILAAAGDLQIHLRTRTATAEEGDALLNEVAAQLGPLLGDRVYSRNGAPLEATVGECLHAAGATVSVAESCTGGLLTQRITDVPGSSAWFAGGFLTYTEESKAALLGINPALIGAHTAVSEPIAAAMATAARTRLNTTYALSVTGYAGPDGGTDRDPVGTVYLGLATPESVTVRRAQFPGDRARVRSFAAITALDLLRRQLIGKR